MRFAYRYYYSLITYLLAYLPISFRPFRPFVRFARSFVWGQHAERKSDQGRLRTSGRGSGEGEVLVSAVPATLQNRPSSSARVD